MPLLAGMLTHCLAQRMSHMGWTAKPQQRRFLEIATMRPYTLAIECFPASPSGGEHHHESQVVHATDDAAAIQQAETIAHDLATSRGSKVVVLVIGPSSGHPIGQSSALAEAKAPVTPASPCRQSSRPHPEVP
jgi:hypothetical protein